MSRPLFIDQLCYTGMIIRVYGTGQMMLGELHALADDGTRMPVFWGYVLPPGLASLVTTWLDTNRIALIFDLDETLLVAHTTASLESRIEQCRATR